MRSIATDDRIALCVSLSASLSVTRLRRAKTLNLLFVLDTDGNPRRIVFDEGPDPATARPRRGEGFNAAFAKLLWPFVCYFLLPFTGEKDEYFNAASSKPL